MPLNVPAVIVVAPAAVEFADEAEANADTRLPDRAPGIPGPVSGHLALGAVSDGGSRGAPVQRPGASLRRGQPMRGPGLQGPRLSRWICHDDRTGTGEPALELDDAEEAEVVPATLAELVDAITARATGSDAHGEGRPSPRPARNGGCTVGCSEAWWWLRRLNAAIRTVPEALEVHSLHGYFLRPTSPGSQTTHVVDSVRDGRSFSIRQVTSEVEGKETFRMTCSFHAPERRRQLPAPRCARRFHRPAMSRDSRRPFHSTSASWVRPSGGKTEPTGRRAVAGSGPVSPFRTTRRCTPAFWPTSPT